MCAASVPIMRCLHTERLEGQVVGQGSGVGVVKTEESLGVGGFGGL